MWEKIKEFLSDVLVIVTALIAVALVYGFAYLLSRLKANNT